MADPLRIEPHPESERSYAELRSQFRADNLARIRALLDDYRINGVRMKILGTPLAAQGATTPGLRVLALDRALCEPVRQDFGLDSVPDSVWERVDKLAQESLTHDLVSHPDGVEHDAPALPIPVERMTDDEVADYVARAIELSKEKEE